MASTGSEYFQPLKKPWLIVRNPYILGCQALLVLGLVVSGASFELFGECTLTKSVEKMLKWNHFPKLQNHAFWASNLRYLRNQIYKQGLFTVNKLVLHSSGMLWVYSHHIYLGPWASTVDKGPIIAMKQALPHSTFPPAQQRETQLVHIGSPGDLITKKDDNVIYRDDIHEYS